MANRGLSAAAITALGDKEVIFYDLLRVDFVTPLYYTTCPHDIDYDGKTFLSNPTLVDLPDIKESLKIKPQTIPLKFSGAEIATHILMLVENYKNADVYIYRYIPSVDDAYLSFKGFCDGHTSEESSQGGTTSISLTVSSHWADWETSNGREIRHENQDELHSGDLGFQYAGVTNGVLKWWGDLAWWVGVNAQGQTYFLREFELNRHADVRRANMRNVYDYEAQSAAVRTLPVIYGNKKVVGTPVFRALSGLFSEFLWVVYAIAEGECDSLVAAYVDDKLAGDASFLGTVMTPSFHAGTTTQVADADLVTNATDWTNSHQLKGVCYVVMRFQRNAKYEWAGEPKVEFEVKGKKLFDPRDSSTAYSRNPALALYDYLLSSAYGKSLSVTDLDVESFKVGADYCESTNQNHGAELGGSINSNLKLFAIRGSIDNAKSIVKNTEMLLFTMRAHLVWTSGLYELVIERDDEVPVYTFDADNTKGSFKFKEAGIKDLANEVYYEWIDPAIDEGSTIELSKSSAFLAEDNNRVLVKRFENKFEGNVYRARNRAATLLKATRQQISLSGLESSNADSLQLQAGRVVGVINESKGWVNKPFRISDMLLKKDGDNVFTLKEYEQSVYDWSISVERPAPPDTTLEDPTFVVPPTNLVLTTGSATLFINSDGTVASRVTATFDKPISSYTSGYKVYYKSAADVSEVFHSDITDYDITEVHIDNLQENVLYEIFIYAYNSLGSLSTALTDSITVLGKEDNPAEPTNLVSASVEAGVVNLSWDDPVDVDFSHFEIKSNTTNNRGGGSIAGTTIGSTFNHATENKRYYWIRAYDKTGNKSGYEPVSATGGLEVTPDGLTSVAEWETISGKPYDGLIINTITARTDFEDQDGDFNNWYDRDGDAGVFGYVVQDADSFIGDFAGLFTSDKSSPAWFEMPRFDISIKASEFFAGKTIRLSFNHKRPSSGAASTFAIQYWKKSNSVGSGYVVFGSAPSSSQYITDSFIYKVPETVGAAQADLIIVNGDLSGNNYTLGTLIDNIVIEVVSDEVILKALTAGSGINVLSAGYATFEDDTVPLLPQNATIEITNDRPYSGGKSLLMHASPSGNTAYVFLAQNGAAYNIKITPNRKWILSGVVYMHAGSGTVNLRAYLYGATSPAFKASSTTWSVTNDSNWHEFVTEIDLTVASHSSLTEVLLRLDLLVNSSTIKVTWDHLMLEEKKGDLLIASGFSLPSPVVGDDFIYGADVTADSPLITVLQQDVLDAQSDATDALDFVDEIDDDLVFSPSEKRAFQIQWSAMQANYLAARDQGIAWGVSVTNLNDARNTLADFLVTTHDIYAGALVASNLSGTQLEDKVTDFYDELQLVLIGISDASISAHGVVDNADVTNYDDYRVTNRIDDSNILFLRRPIGGSRTYDITKTHAIVIVLPQSFTDEVVKFKVDVTYLNSNGSFTIAVGGRLESSTDKWKHRFAQIYGNTESNNEVRFGKRNSDDKAVIMIGTLDQAWDEPKITVYDVQIGDQNDSVLPNYQDWDDNWAIDFSTPSNGAYSMPTIIPDALLDANSVAGLGVIQTDNMEDGSISSVSDLYVLTGLVTGDYGWETSSDFSATITGGDSRVTFSVGFIFKKQDLSSGLYCCQWRIIRTTGGVETLLIEGGITCVAGSTPDETTHSFSITENVPTGTALYEIQCQAYDDGVNDVGHCFIHKANYDILEIKK